MDPRPDAADMTVNAPYDKKIEFRMVREREAA